MLRFHRRRGMQLGGGALAAVPSARRLRRAAAVDRGPKHTPYRDVMRNALPQSYKGPPSEAAAAVKAEFVVVDMFASVCAGQVSPEEAAAEAQRRAERYFKADLSRPLAPCMPRRPSPSRGGNVPPAAMTPSPSSRGAARRAPFSLPLAGQGRGGEIAQNRSSTSSLARPRRRRRRSDPRRPCAGRATDPRALLEQAAGRPRRSRGARRARPPRRDRRRRARSSSGAPARRGRRRPRRARDRGRSSPTSSKIPSSSEAGRRLAARGAAAVPSGGAGRSSPVLRPRTAASRASRTPACCRPGRAPAVARDRRARRTRPSSRPAAPRPGRRTRRAPTSSSPLTCQASPIVLEAEIAGVRIARLPQPRAERPRRRPHDDLVAVLLPGDLRARLVLDDHEIPARTGRSPRRSARPGCCPANGRCRARSAAASRRADRRSRTARHPAGRTDRRSSR